MRYPCSMVAFVDGGLTFVSLVFQHQFLDLFFRSLRNSSAGFNRQFRSHSSASDLADSGTVGWKCRMRSGGIKRPLALFTAFLKVFSACSTVLVSSASERFSSQASA